jgi:molybdopterin/thiamine biosynthesis adenylyltransferase
VSSAPANLEGLEDLLSRRYSLSVSNGHLIVNDVWYIDEADELMRGRLAAPLTLAEESKVGTPRNHQMFWSGSAPRYVDRAPIPLGARGVANVTIGGTTFPWHLSNKDPGEKFVTYTALVEHYVALISGPAEQKFGVTSRTGATYDVPGETSPFKVQDTFSALAEITDLNALLTNDRIAIIGLGGTGAFLLDFMVKTPVHSIDAYDFDVFEVHNGFRSPGEVPFDLFGQPKTALYQHKYEAFRHRLHFHRRRVGTGDDALFADTTFAFICIDDGESRAEICAMLRALKVPFIDVGMGVEKESGRLDGLIRTTLFTEHTSDRAIADVPLDARGEQGAYRVFVQIAELNAINAAVAVLRYKQMRGFYADDAGYYNSLFSIGSSRMAGAT